MRLTSKLVSIATRWTYWSEGQIFTIAPEQISFVDGLRTALGMAVVLGLSLYLRVPDLGYAVVAVFWTCLCDPGGSDKFRLGTMAWLMLLCAVVMGLASYAAYWGQWMGGAGLFALVLACGLTRTYKPAFGPTPAQSGLIAAIAVVIGIASPRGFVGSLQLGGYVVAGGLWAIVLCLGIWRSSSPASGRQMLIGVFSRLEEMVASLEALDALSRSDDSPWGRFNTVYRRAARISIERGRAVVGRMTSGRSRYGAGLDAAGRTFAAVIAIGHFRHRSNGRFETSTSLPLVKRLRDALQSVSRQVDGQARDTTALLNKLALLSSDAEKVDNTVGRAVSFASRALQDMMSRWEDPDAPEEANSALSFLPNVSFNAAVLRHSLRVATAVLICYVVGLTFDVSFSYWGAIATLVIMQPLVGNTWLRVLERALGSFCGGLIAAALISQLSNSVQMSAVIVVLSIAVIALRLVNYGLFVIFLTPMFMLLSDYIRPSEGLILARLINECLGACLGLAASFLLWPEKQIDTMAGLISDAAKANLEFAAAVLRSRAEDTVTLDKLQRDAGLASSRVEAGWDRLWLEGRGRTVGEARLGELSQALRSICGAAAVLEISSPATADERRAANIEKISANLQRRIGTADLDEPPVPLLAEDSDDLGQAVKSLVDAVNDYLQTKRTVS
ncbi:FUSC family protein [Rhizobium calliandrae]|uniref:FUSC family protein n=1 Tax=Rhizobium calliandrae TaxID=1312182 RepID=A0ABT7KH58_9HYPH|nr:FUSC family protein [Rhizobium calliandrae]MDL2407756.1 FUSC family protein [Rhizobium calliandrae]